MIKSEFQSIQYADKTKKGCSEEVAKTSPANTPPVETPHYKLYREALRARYVEIL